MTIWVNGFESTVSRRLGLRVPARSCGCERLGVKMVSDTSRELTESQDTVIIGSRFLWRF
jgi:hypothetical protein